MNEAERKHVARQYNYNRVPHPLMEGLVFVGFGPVTPQKAFKYIEAMREKIEENETTKILDSN